MGTVSSKVTGDHDHSMDGRRRKGVRFLLSTGFLIVSVGGASNSDSILILLARMEQKHCEALVSGQTISGGGVPPPQNSSLWRRVAPD